MSMRSWLLPTSDSIAKAGVARPGGATILVLLLLGILGCGDRMAGAVSTGNTARISGVVKDSTGRAVDAEVSLVRMSHTGAVVVAEMPTDADGSFEFGSLPAGRYRVVVDEDSARGAVVEGIELGEAQKKNLGTIVVNVYIVNNINITINNYVIQNIYLNTPDNPLAPSGGQIVLRASPDSGQVIYVVAKDAQGREQLVRFRLDYAEGRPVFTQLDPTGMPADIDTIPAVPVCTPVASTPATSHFALDAHTVALWRFDEGCGDTAYDASRNRLHGRLDSGASRVSGEFGGAVRFAPGNGIVAIPYTPKLDLSAFTIEARIRLSNLNGNPLVLKIGDDGNVNFEFAITDDGRLTGYIETEEGYDKVVTGQTQLQVGRWTDIAFSYDGRTVRLFIDGVLDAESLFGLAPSEGPGLIWIGHHVNSSDNIFNGSVDELRISDSARYTPETTYFPIEASTVALWTFDTSTGEDLSPNHLDLTASAPPSFLPSPHGKALVCSSGSGTFVRPYDRLLTTVPTGMLFIEARVKIERYPEAGETFSVAGPYEGLRLNIWAGGALQACTQRGDGSNWTWNAPLTRAGAVPLNKWVTLAVGADQETREAYAWIDGQPVQLYNLAVIPGDRLRVSTRDFEVGGGDQSGKFIGLIEEIRVSNALIRGPGLPVQIDPGILGSN